ncbi:YeeE/YedE family integral membrane protein [Dothidotthia symphoricarpi CBS 119687]|uniref:YeeE/YedE family integral membrane protein n=1 Tax=Dothidotthia symphoricarpi CBS 119687 TaxID=1392245 RepID=A0A6A6AG88_9PLEO|nr:YeeE/YedE family integral membrane protein [Dothidotthia symphoricarpi CBS 119687]KAF2130929.1 YeeE/YedE family integral membrane protein [Dothidotthia symphoricarpi CBS 119687]
MFTPVETTIGALLIHQATSNLLYQNGNILGVSGFLRRVFSTPTKETVAFFVGMAASHLPLKALAPQLITSYPPVPNTIRGILATLGVGIAVGWGTKVSNGCTSGHMLCGLPRLSGRSAAAVATFFPIAVLTHHFVNPTLYTQVCSGDQPCYTPVYPSASATASLVLLAALSMLAARTIPSLMSKTTTTSTNELKRSGISTPSAREATQFFSGLLFALGLQVSQMSHSAKVSSFFSFPVMQYWDPSLVLVILFGMLPSLFEIRRKGFSSSPSFAKGFSLPKKTFKDVDARFLAGAATFGVAFGLTGACPGPAVLRAFAQPVWGALWMGGFWVGGML